MNVEALERALGRTLENRRALIPLPICGGSRWTFIGSGLIHPRFKATLEHISPQGGRPRSRGSYECERNVSP